jgi:hypothetical protein
MARVSQIDKILTVHGRSAALVHHNIDKGRLMQDVDSAAIASTDQRKRTKR